MKNLSFLISSLTNYVDDLEMFAPNIFASSTSGESISRSALVKIEISFSD